MIQSYFGPRYKPHYSIFLPFPVIYFLRGQKFGSQNNRCFLAERLLRAQIKSCGKGKVRFFAHSDESSSDPSSNFSVFTFDSASRVMTSFCFRAFRVDSRRGVLSTHNSALFIGVLVWLINRAIT